MRSNEKMGLQEIESPVLSISNLDNYGLNHHIATN
ncbi:hypothetical protein C21_04582 [Arenibacter sp. NBRC 103722]|nr:hypothetical protein C21_04582 [Arenibacter sp. NBRC 103722]